MAVKKKSKPSIQKKSESTSVRKKDETQYYYCFKDACEHSIPTEKNSVKLVMGTLKILHTADGHKQKSSHRLQGQYKKDQIISIDIGSRKNTYRMLLKKRILQPSIEILEIQKLYTSETHKN